MKNVTNNATATNSSNYVIENAPFKITKCDQIILFQGKRINPEMDFGAKVPAIFTMSTFMLNVFESKNTANLIRSLRIKDINGNPYVLKGSKNCLFFEETTTRKNVTMCVEDDQQRKDIIDSFGFLKNCLSNLNKSPHPVSISGNKKNKIVQMTMDKKIIDLLKILNDPNQKVLDIHEMRKGIIKELKSQKVIKIKFTFNL